MVASQTAGLIRGYHGFIAVTMLRSAGTKIMAAIFRQRVDGSIKASGHAFPRLRSAPDRPKDLAVLTIFEIEGRPFTGKPSAAVAFAPRVEIQMTPGIKADLFAPLDIAGVLDKFVGGHHCNRTLCCLREIRKIHRTSGWVGYRC